LANKIDNADFKDLIENILQKDRIYNTFETAYDNDSLFNETDPKQTRQQRLRDEETTRLYRQFVDSHEEKQKFARNKKNVIFWFCIVWVSLFTLACVVLSFYTIFYSPKSVNDIIMLISAIVPMVAAIVGTLNIVAKHVFPEDEEKNITEIVKAINDNDLKDKTENLKQENLSRKENTI